MILAPEIIVRAPEFTTVKVPLVPVVTAALIVNIEPVKLTPPTACVSIAPLKVVVPVPASCESVAAVIVDPAVTLAALLIIKSPSLVLPTTPVNVILPAPAAIVSPCEAEEVPLTVPLKRRFAPFVPIEILDPNTTLPVYVCAFALYIEPFKVIPSVEPLTVTAPETPAETPPIPVKVTTPTPFTDKLVSAVDPPIIPLKVCVPVVETVKLLAPLIVPPKRMRALPVETVVFPPRVVLPTKIEKVESVVV